MKRKIITLLLTLSMIPAVLCGCGDTATISGDVSTSKSGDVSTTKNGTDSTAKNGTDSTDKDGTNSTAENDTDGTDKSGTNGTAKNSKNSKTTAKQGGQKSNKTTAKKKNKTAATADFLVTNSGAEIPLSSLGYATNSASAPVVYYTSDISAKSMLAVYKALNFKPKGKVGVKLSTGEPPASNYLDPKLIKGVVDTVKGTIVECNTAYGGSRSSVNAHYQVAKDHGFTAIADFKLLDEDGSMTLPVKGGLRLKENYVGEAFADFNSYVVLSHFKGHAMAGYGGAIKNISIGFGSGESGKAHIHSGGTGGSMWGGEQDAFLEAMADAGKSVSDYLGNGDRIVYVSVMNRLSVDCDCDGNPAEPDMHDIGILASSDPVALDQACIDLVYAAPDTNALPERIESRNGIHTIEAADKIGLGSRKYRPVNISE